MSLVIIIILIIISTSIKFDVMMIKTFIDNSNHCISDSFLLSSPSLPLSSFLLFERPLPLKAWAGRQHALSTVCPLSVQTSDYRGRERSRWRCPRWRIHRIVSDRGGGEGALGSVYAWGRPKGPVISMHVRHVRGCPGICIYVGQAKGPWDKYARRAGTLGSVYTWGWARGPWDQYTHSAGRGGPRNCIRLGWGERALGPVYTWGPGICICMGRAKGALGSVCA